MVCKLTDINPIRVDCTCDIPHSIYMRHDTKHLNTVLIYCVLPCENILDERSDY